MTTYPTRTHNEEPEPSSEESIPLDGRDTVGEEMMKDLGRDLKKKGVDRTSSEGVDPEADPGPMPEQFPVS
jgi:hypothetical protein